jgi:hypothetical protein
LGDCSIIHRYGLVIRLLIDRVKMPDESAI